MAKPVGELKKIVSLVDRTDFDEYVYPKDTDQTVFLSKYVPYHTFQQEATNFPFAGSPNWGQRLTFTMPWPWPADFLNYLTLRFKPNSWLTPDMLKHLGPELNDWVPMPNDNAFWIWTNSLGIAAVEHAEMEIDGVTVEEFSGDWINVWSKCYRDASSGIATDEMLGSHTKLSRKNIFPSEDGYIYCPLPFWFSRFANSAFPLVSCAGPNTVRFHVTLRPFSAVVRKLVDALDCKESPCNHELKIRNYYSEAFTNTRTIQIESRIPSFETVDFLCGLSNIDGELRTAYRDQPHEMLMYPIVETNFSEPLKYVVNTGSSDTIKIGLPILGNGPIRQMLFFLRRKASIDLYNEYTNYSGLLTSEMDPVWNPVQPLLKRAQLMIGTAVWADEDEAWWRANAIDLPGGVRAYGNYIYCYNFADRPHEFSPSGSLNMSRVDVRLNLTVAVPASTHNTEWTVTVFLMGTNWMRFQNGLANVLFMD